MKYIIATGTLLAYQFIFCQTNTDLFLVGINDGKLEFDNPLNISHNEGYDNQPSFYDDEDILFSSTRNGQTDIALYHIKSGAIDWISNTPGASEYSPTKIPNKNSISAIRLDTNGLQRLYEYDIGNGNRKKLLKDLKVGYHVWFSPEILVTTVLVDTRMDLVIVDPKKNTTKTVYKKVGRSLHKIPNTNLVSFVMHGDKTSILMSLNPLSGETKKIITLTDKSDDICWMNDGTVLTGYGKTILKFNSETDNNWQELASFTDKNINKISRLAINDVNTKLVLVAEESPENIVQKQVEAFNRGDLDAFVSCYTKNVLVQNFPNDTSYVGKSNMKASYKKYFTHNPDTKVKVTNLIVIGNTVIDEELVSVSGKNHQLVAIYEVTNGNIKSMTFIHRKSLNTDAEKVVQEQLDAYNSRNIEAFVNTYTDDIKVFDFPNKPRFEGKDKMRESYGSFFESTPDLNCEIKNRIVIGNKVIDEEFLTINGINYNAVAIYEIENGKIAKVTFVR
ncbi:MAG: nuclear transport factor 2 family protein [Maribacter sp.]